MPRLQNKYSQAGNVNPAWLLLVIVWVGLLGFAAVNRQNLQDTWQLRGYQAPAEVAALADQDTMTPNARKVFDVNHPSILAKNIFSNSCPNNGGEQTIVLGCYHGGQNGIFLLQVSDPRLSGVQQVTAAHEMLHGAYDRLSSKERKRVDALLNDYYQHDLHDQRILNTIAAYKKSEPHDVTNEMHSVFGTEVADLPPGLESYYKQYFTDRSRVTGYAAAYQAEFSSRQAAVTQDDAQLKALKAQIDDLEANLRSEQADITDRQTSLANLRSNGDTTSYNAAVPGYNQLVSQYNRQVESLKAMVDQYNQLVAARNETAGEIDSLVKDLTASASTIQ